MAEAKQRPLTVEEFLAWEQAEPLRYELVDGQPMAMAGGTVAHDLVRGAVYSDLRRQLRGALCRTTLDVKLVCPSGNVRYPDVAVDCGPLSPSSQIASEPRVAIEVLSPSTRATDFIVKLKDYGSIPSVSTYLIFWQDEPRVAVFRRSGDAFVSEAIFEGLDAVVDLPSIGARLVLTDVYADFPA
jgi:Uma2 family endonuclease